MLTQRHMRSYPHWKWRSVWGITTAASYAASRTMNLLLVWGIHPEPLVVIHRHVLPYLVIVGLLGMFIQGMRIAKMLHSRRHFPHYDG